MKRELLSIWRCPACTGTDTALEVDQEEDEILAGNVLCRPCGQRYQIDAGILHTHPRLPTGLVAEIANARRNSRPEEGIVFPLRAPCAINDQWLLSLPVPFYHAGSWNPQLDLAFVIHATDLRQDQRALDLGAGVCWTTRDLARACQHCVAVDVLDDKYLGLASASTYIAHTGDFFERVNSLMEATPFRDGVFDLVLSNCSAHHANDLDRLFQEVKRLLRPGGCYVLSNELTQGTFKHSPLEGNDQYYTIADYCSGLERNGLHATLHFPPALEAALNANALRRKNGRWPDLGRWASRGFRLPLARRLVHATPRVVARLFGVPLIMIARRSGP